MSSQNKVITIVIPFYNTDPSLFSKCLQRLELLPVEDVEVIVVDDGSDAIHAGYLDRVSRGSSCDVSVYHKKNGGQNSAREYGMRLARGEYLLFHDSDDYIEVEPMRKVVDRLRASDVDVLAFGYDLVSVSGGVLGVVSPWKEGFTSISKKELLINSDGLCRQCYRLDLLRQFAGGLAQGLKIGEDLASALACAANSKSAESFGSIVYHYVQRPDSVLHAPDPESTFDILKSFEYVFGHCEYESGAMAEEIEWMAILHVLRWGSERAINNHCDLGDVKKAFFSWMNSYFPHWRQNSYLSKEKIAKTPFFVCSINGHWGVCRLLSIIGRVAARSTAK